MAVASRKQPKTFLDDLDRIMDWKPIESFLKKKLRHHQHAVGNPAYLAQGIFKILDSGTKRGLKIAIAFVHWSQPEGGGCFISSPHGARPAPSRSLFLQVEEGELGFYVVVSP